MQPEPPDDLNHIILSFVRSDWRKVALVVGSVLHWCEDRQIKMDEQEIVKKIVALIDAKKIENQGDISDWRRSEVRFRQSDS
ncbi:DUF3658 domain-containing protein [Nitrobacter sp. 62-23]|uniref:DUF3658 domain-containing protein n=1 Tax=Nitrobacter sp. 62-23 TaxID=1895798 RepID=UPI00092652D0|nr:DUF3658 domain-containing protein [Nitrobacter sp. 62-23]OJU99311.1 MAG: hypothetical protein BGO16_06435 [Nitrobacter sp. 62-23]